MQSDSPHVRRQPRLVVAGVAGGVGTTAVALVLGGSDARVFTGRPTDIIVCRTTAESLVRASRAVSVLGTRLGAVAVNSLDSTRPARPVAARLRLLESSAATVVMPFVPALLSAADPHGMLRSALRTAEADLSRPIRRFLIAVRQLAEAADQRPVAAPPPRNYVSSRPSQRDLTR